jgi:DHA2 family multidrug resistance protein
MNHSSEEIHGSKFLISVIAMGAALLALLNVTIVNVALNDIRATFGTPMDQIGWVSTGYMVANVVIIPITGWLQKRFGYRRCFVYSIVIFTVSSALCGLAWNLPSLVFFRALQGIGGGAIIPTAQTVLFARYSKAEHGMAGAIYGLGAVTGPVLGPALGGYIIEIANWHWVFLVSVPIGAVLCIMGNRVLHQPYFKPTRDSVDVRGIALLAVGLASLQYALEEGNREDWFESKLIFVASAVSITALITFIVHELETSSPVVDLRVFANRQYTAVTGVNFLTGVAIFAGSYLSSLYCGAVMHYTALEMGKVFLLGGLGGLIVMPIVGGFGNKVDPRVMMMTGIVGVVVSLWLYAGLTERASFLQLVLPNFVQSTAIGLVFVPLNLLALSELPQVQCGNATGLLNLTRELGGSIGTAWMGLVISNQTKIETAFLGEHLNATSLVYQEQLADTAANLGAYTWTRELVGEAAIGMRVQLQALVRSFNRGYTETMLVFAIALVMLVFMKRPKPTTEALPMGH